jgi:hypothetical protein
LATPPDLDADFWSQPDIVTAIEHGDLGQFLLAVRGARRPRWSQDQIAFWLCCAQSRISDPRKRPGGRLRSASRRHVHGAPRARIPRNQVGNFI